MKHSRFCGLPGDDPSRPSMSSHECLSTWRSYRGQRERLASTRLVARFERWDIQVGLHYLPLSPAFFFILAGIYLLVVAMLRAGVLRYAYLQLGIGSGTVLLLLLASLAGSYFNVPLVELPKQPVVSHREIGLHGMRYARPVVVDWPGVIIAVNIGGAVIPGLFSLYLLLRNSMWALGIVATACVTAVCHLLAHPVAGVGITVPLLAPSLTAGFAALILSRRHAAALAYVAGSMGTLIGADLLNLGSLRFMGASVVSIGGAGTFDGVFLTGILAVMIASMSGGGRPAHRTTPR